MKKLLLIATFVFSSFFLHAIDVTVTTGESISAIIYLSNGERVEFTGSYYSCSCDATITGYQLLIPEGFTFLASNDGSSLIITLLPV